MRKFIPLFILILLLSPVQAGAVSLFPDVVEISSARGVVVSSQISVINTKGVEQTYYLGSMKFKPSDDGKSPKFISSQEDHTELPEWIVFPYTEFQVAAHQKIEIPFQIAIPSDISSGGYYGAVTVSQSPSDLVESNGATIEAVTASLILLTVEGETIQKAELLDYVDHGASVRSGLASFFTFRLQNQGNVHLTPSGSILFKDLFGRVIAELDANPSNSRILPSSTRTYEVGTVVDQQNFLTSIQQQFQHFAFGPITTELIVHYGSSQEVIQSQSTFWYVPWQLIVVMLVLLGGCLKILLYKRKDSNRSVKR